MPRFVFGLLICLVCCCTALLADTPGEEAVKDAIKTLRAKRAAVKDKADQALLDTAIRDLEGRLAQAGKGEPKPEDKKDEPFVMPKNWELKFNTGAKRPAYDPKSGELKLAYDFADAKQLKDFELPEGSQSAVKKGVLTVERKEQLRHAVKFKAVRVSLDLYATERGVHLTTEGGLSLETNTTNRPKAFNLRVGDDSIAQENTTSDTVRQLVTVRDLFMTENRCGATVNGVKVSGAIKNGNAGRLVLKAGTGLNQFTRLTLTGTIDPEWAKDFFADKK
jgi:hypothetical protein